MKRFLIAALSIAACGSIHAGPSSLKIGTAADLYSACKIDQEKVISSPSSDQNATLKLVSCIQYVTGAIEGHNAVVGYHLFKRGSRNEAMAKDISAYCRPQNSTVNDAIQDILKFIEKNRENKSMLQSPAASIVVFALQNKYPCK